MDKQPRNEVIEFSHDMERKLQENDHKGGWKNCRASYLKRRLKDEVKELLFQDSDDLKAVIDECADVANFAMMIADIARKKLKGANKPGGEV